MLLTFLKYCYVRMWSYAIEAYTFCHVLRSFRLLVKYKLVVIFVPTKTSLIRFVYYEIWSRIVAIVKIDYNVIIPVTYEVRYVLVLYAETYSYFSMLITWNSLDFHSELCFSCYYNFTYLIWNKKVILHITK